MGQSLFPDPASLSPISLPLLSFLISFVVTTFWIREPLVLNQALVLLSLQWEQRAEGTPVLKRQTILLPAASLGHCSSSPEAVAL